MAFRHGIKDHFRLQDQVNQTLCGRTEGKGLGFVGFDPFNKHRTVKAATKPMERRSCGGSSVHLVVAAALGPWTLSAGSAAPGSCMVAHLGVCLGWFWFGEPKYAQRP